MAEVRADAHDCTVIINTVGGYVLMAEVRADARDCTVIINTVGGMFLWQKCALTHVTALLSL